MAHEKSLQEKIAHYQGAVDTLWHLLDMFSDLGGREDAGEYLLGTMVKLAAKLKYKIKQLEEERKMWDLFESEVEEEG